MYEKYIFRLYIFNQSSIRMVLICRSLDNTVELGFNGHGYNEITAL